MSKIFLSYHRQTQDKARILVDDIEALSHTVWFDQELSGGQAWWDKILETIRDCDVFVFALSPDALDSTACQREYAYAEDVGKPILPVLLAEGVSTHVLPPALSQLQFVDYRKHDRDAVLRVARAFTTIPPAKPLADPLPAPPDAPISYLGSLTEQIAAAPLLTYEKQSVLVVDLKRSLRDPETADDARGLLQRLRKRRDLLATIAEEIDEALASRTAAAAPPRATTQQRGRTSVDSVEETKPKTSSTSQTANAQTDSSRSGSFVQSNSFGCLLVPVLLGFVVLIISLVG